MKPEYDFSKSIKNPYAKKVKRQIFIKIEEDTIEYFKNLAIKVGIPYQNLINPNYALDFYQRSANALQ